MIRKIVIPARYLKIAKQRGTKSLQGSDGRMRGRFAVKKGAGDTTKVRYFAKDVNLDLNRDGKISPSERFEAGEIFGRTTKVKGSSRSRGTIRRF